MAAYVSRLNFAEEGPHLYNVRIVRGYLEYIQNNYPDIDIDEILGYAGITRYQLQDSGYWLTQEQADRFQKIGIEKTGNPDLPRESGRMVVSGNAFRPFRQFVLGFLTPATLYKGIERLTPKLTRGGTMVSRNLGKNRLEVIARPAAGVREKPYQCTNRIGFLEGTCKLLTGNYADVEHTTCVHRGDDCCRYIITWETSPRYYLNRLRAFLSLFFVSASTAGAFLLPLHPWVEMSLSFLVMICSLSWLKESLEKQDMSRMIQHQAETAELFMEESNTRHDNATLIEEIGAAVSTILDTNELLDSVLNRLSGYLAVDHALIMLFKAEDPGRIEYARGYGLSAKTEQALKNRTFRLNGEMMPESIFSRSKPLTVHEPEHMPGPLAELLAQVTNLMGTSSCIVAPIMFKQEPTGFLILDPPVSGRALTDSDIRIIMGVARQIAIGLHYAQAYQRIEASESNYRRVVENAGVGIIVIRDGMCCYVNQKAVEISGFPEKEILAEPALNRIHPDDREKAGSFCTRGTDDQEGPERNVVRMVRKDGSIRRIATSRVKVSWQSSDAMLYFIHDITDELDAKKALEDMNSRLESIVEARTQELKTANERLVSEIAEHHRTAHERRELKERLDSAQKMETLGHLASGVAHDLNNVLSGIVSYPELILMGLPDESPMRKPIQRMRDSGLKAAAIVQDLLTLARRGATQSKVLNLNRDIVLSFLESQECTRLKGIHPSIRIETSLEPDLRNIKGAAAPLMKSLVNLVVNAIEAQPEGGKVVVSTRNADVSDPLNGYDTIPPGMYAVLSVCDSGIGIVSDDLKRIFEPFYTRKIMRRSGTGLGMTVVLGTVQDHRGYIDVKSEVGKGSCFELYFPVTDEDPADRKSDMVSIRDYMGNREIILVVDDVEEQRNIATRILERLNYTAVSVPSGEKAVEYARGNHVDLVLLDMIMDPGIDGLETYRGIIEHRPGQKAVIASGYAENARVEEAIRLGVGKYIRKPYSIEYLGQVIKQELAR